MGPAFLVAILSAVAVYFTVAPSGFFVSATQTPASAAFTLLMALLAVDWVIGSIRTSRDRLARERERYIQLAESRDLLYRELQHRVANNIQIISGLLLLQGQSVADRAAKRAITEASTRISLIGRIQRQLHDHAGERAPFNRFAQELLTDAIAASGAVDVALQVEGGDKPLNELQATPVSLVMLECVNNALEHAFGSGAGGTIHVSLSRAGARHILTVADDGEGLPEGADPEATTSLGLKIVRAMASQLGGAFSLDRADPGVVCRLDFPALDP